MSKLRKQSYYLKCKIIVKRPYLLTFWQNQRETVQVLLVPQEGDQKTFWQSAWVPPTELDTYEGLITVGSPFNVERARVAIHAADSKYKNEPYMMVMDKDLEDLLIARKNQSVMVQMLSEDQDSPFEE